MNADRFDPRLLIKPLRGTFRWEDQLPKFLEIMRWPRRRTCPHCRSVQITTVNMRARKPEGRYLYSCKVCRYQFTVTTGTALHGTHVPMAKWIEAIAMIRGDSARSLKAGDLVRRLGVTHKTARLMCLRLRRGMRAPFVRNLYVALRAYKTPEPIYRNLFPHLYGDCVARESTRALCSPKPTRTG